MNAGIYNWPNLNIRNFFTRSHLSNEKIISKTAAKIESVNEPLE